MRTVPTIHRTFTYVTDFTQTGMASLITGATVGLSRSTTIISVRYGFADNGVEVSSKSSLNEAIDWVIEHIGDRPGRPAIINISGRTYRDDDMEAKLNAVRLHARQGYC